MAGSVTVATQSTGTPRPVRRYAVTWTSDASGVVSVALTHDGGNYFSGELLRVTFKPGASGVQPTDLYDVTITDVVGVDVLAGQGANLSNANTTHVCPGVPVKDGTTTSTRPIAVDDTLTLAVANAGNAKQGTIVLYLR